MSRPAFRLALLAGLAVSLAAPPVADAASPFRRPKGAARAAAPAPKPAPDVVAARLRDQALKGSIAYGLVEDITTRFGPRMAGSESERRAAEWGAQELKRLGFVNVAVEDFPLQGWTRGQESAEVTAPFRQPLVVNALGGSPATPPGGIEAEAALFETYADLQAAPTGSLNGKIAVVLQETARVQTGAGYGATSAIRSQGPDTAKAKGAVAFVLRSLGTHDHRFPHTGSTRRSEGAIPSFAISPPDADQLRRIAERGPKDQPLRLRLFSTASDPAPGRSQNVVGEVRGREKPDEVIVIGGHLDSWDLGTGAVDDAAGVAITTAALKLIADLPYKPRRTIRVVWWGSEELSQPAPKPGLAGAQAYADARKDVLGGHVIASESDFGAGRIYSFVLPAGFAGSDLQKTAARVLAPLAINFDPSPATSGGPDTGPLFQKGVPVFRLQQDGSDYFDVHHTPNDVIDRIDPKAMDQNVAAWAALLWLIADSDVDFRNPPPPPAKPAS